MRPELLTAILAVQEGMRTLRRAKAEIQERSIDDGWNDGDREQHQTVGFGFGWHATSGNDNSGGRLQRATQGMAKPGRFHASRIHKASSAESILKHCLRQLGYTARWREGRLTGRQHLKLLEAVRQYGRAWMRHEAESFFEHYGVRDERQPLEGMARSGEQKSSHGATDDFRGSNLSENGFSRTSEEIERAIANRILSPLRRWFNRAKSFVRETIHAGVMAMVGRPLEADESVEADRLAGIQDKFLDSFETEFTYRPSPEVATPTPTILPKPISAAQFAARAEMYGNAAWQAAQKVQRKRIFKQPVNVVLDEKGKVVDLVAEPPGFEIQYPIAGPPPGRGKGKRPPRPKSGGPIKWERRVLGHPKTEHCADCPPLAAMGWQPAGTLPDIGDTECEGRCLCHFVYSDSIEQPEVKGEKPKPPAKELTEEVIPIAYPPKQIMPPKPQATREPTKAEIDAEVKKWIAGKPSKLTIKKPVMEPEPEFVLPEGYEWSGPE